jgi:ankyrin repeat protein
MMDALGPKHMRKHLESVLASGYNDMASFILEIRPTIYDTVIPTTATSPHRESYYRHLSRWNRPELVRLLVENDEIELIRGEYLRLFRWYVSVIVNKNTVEQFRTPLSKEMMYLVYEGYYRQTSSFSYIDWFVGVNISESDFVDALRNKKISPIAHPSGHNHRGETCLHECIRKQHYEMAKWLVCEQGVNVDMVNQDIRTPLHTLIGADLVQLRERNAVWKQFTSPQHQLARLLIMYGASVDGYPKCVREFRNRYKVYIAAGVLVGRRCTRDVVHVMFHFLGSL